MGNWKDKRERNEAGTDRTQKTFTQQRDVHLMRRERLMRDRDRRGPPIAVCAELKIRL